MKHRLPRFHGAGYMPPHAAHDGYRMLAVHSGERLVQRVSRSRRVRRSLCCR